MGEIRLSISSTLHKELKQIALDRGISLKQLISDVFRDYTKEYKQQTSTVSKEERR